MTPGTSPRPGGSPRAAWTAGDAVLQRARAKVCAPWLARGAASAHLAALGILLTTAWRDGAAGEAAPAGFGAWHLAFVLATGAVAALLSLSGASRAALGRGTSAGAGGSVAIAELLAQMSHELRTPLNAVIGFSEAMLRELHGPLGHARYHEYAHHISESGGRLLKSSEQALAMTEAISALIGDGSGRDRRRVCAHALVREAWRGLRADALGAELGVVPGQATVVSCETGATRAALECLLRHALLQTAGAARVTVSSGRCGGVDRLEIRVRRTGRAPERGCPSTDTGLLLALARLLLETQGIALACTTGDDGCWSAVLRFAAAS